jgi:hypothetical protein
MVGRLNPQIEAGPAPGPADLGAGTRFKSNENRQPQLHSCFGGGQRWKSLYRWLRVLLFMSCQ